MCVLKKVRIERNMSQKEVAMKIGVTATTICRYESGKRKLPLEIAKKLADVFDISWQQFYEENNVEKS